MNINTNINDLKDIKERSLLKKPFSINDLLSIRKKNVKKDRNPKFLVQIKVP